MAKKPQPQVQTTVAHVENPWLGRGLLGVAGVAVLLVIVGYLTGAVSDGLLGVVLAAAVGVLSTIRVVGAMLETSGTPLARVGVLVLGLATVGLSFAPVALTIFPGTPVATGVLTEVGSTVQVPDTLKGAVRVLVHGGLNTAGAAAVEFSLGGFTSSLEGKLQRTVTTQRVGRRGSAQEAHERNSEFLDGRLAAGHQGVKLESVEGPLAGGLSLQVFSDRFPLWLDLLLSAVVLALLAVLGVWLHVGSDVVVTGGLALAFGAVAHEFVTPDSIIRPMIGAVIVAAVAGGAAGGIFAWAARKALPATAPAPRTRA
jgi:hypothetical protein